MLYWSLTAEFIALLLITVLAMNFYEKRQVKTHFVKMYRVCLVLSAASILLDTLCVLLLEYPLTPRWLNFLLNTAYFLLCVLMCSVMAVYLFEKLLAHVYDQTCVRRAHRVVGGLFAAYCVLLAVNVRSGWLFWLDEVGNYQRGPLYNSGYLLMLVEFVLLYYCYFQHRASVSKMMQRSLRILLPVLLALVAMQLWRPELLLNGTLIAFVDIVLYLNFQSQRIELDGVTGLSNRDSFFNELGMRLRGGQKFQVVLLSLSNFSVINRRYGHRRGDEFLYTVANWIEQSFPEGEHFRYGSVTFAVLLPYTGSTRAQQYRDRFQTRFCCPWQLGKCNYHLSASLCDLVHLAEAWQPDQVIEYLDYTLSHAKSAGGEWVCFEQGFAQALSRRRHLAEVVRERVRNREFSVWYQPIYDLGQNGFCSAEALVRMRDERGAFVSPEEFIPIAEELGLINDVFWIVLEDVCRLLHSRPGFSLHVVSVNVAMPQMEDITMVDRIEETLRRYQVPARRLRFEITERALAGDTAAATRTLERLAQNGFLFYLDDFGTGYSNFSSVLQAPLECIKLDKSLVDNLGQSERGDVLVGALIQLFHSLGMGVVAEGVETQPQVERLKNMGADCIQGYFYARPMPQPQLENFLACRLSHNV